MNQFKKAKQLRSESGQATESITDLTTAGVAQKTENTKISAPDEKTTSKNIEEPSPNKGIFVQNTETSVTIEKTIPKNNEEPSPNEFEKTIPENDKSSVPEEKNYSQNTIDTSTTAKAAINEQEYSAQFSTSTTGSAPIPLEPSIMDPTQKTVYNQPLAQTTTPIPAPSYENATPNNNIPMAQGITGNNQESIVIAPQRNNIPIVQEIVQPNYTAPTVYENNSFQSSVIQPFHEPQPAQELTTSPQSNGRKKSAPNIFAPKGEAKSMRKSLVLKPTSVKIAENYCEKNGGSFNELIQTLLDNFIDEYGL